MMYLALLAAVTPAVEQAPLSYYITVADMAVVAKDGREGTVAVELSVDTKGRVDGCVIAKSSGHALLDSATCLILSRRARFDSARDERGNPVADVVSGHVEWKAVRSSE
ncbi:MAG: TonB family protein [Sphingomicrobium sp.]